jgi:hypothetical protein
MDVTDGDADRSVAVPETVQELKKQLREKDMVLTDIRLEALSSAHQLEALKETVSRMRVGRTNCIEHCSSNLIRFSFHFRTKCLR